MKALQPKKVTTMPCERYRAKVGKFLGTFASQSATMTPVHIGVNQSNLVVCEYELTSALASGETATLTLPTVSKDIVPVAMAAWSLADPALPLMQPHTANSLVMTSFDRDTGILICTAGSAGVADDTVISVLFIAATEGTA